ncbi:MAG TPA: redoxin domain-containing protein [Sulfurovum sp.]|nr:redoxin domain-containing protein [Sulfurovum sp.]
MSKWNVRSLAKELIVGAVLIFILSNIINYLRKPELSSTELPQANITLLDGTSYTLKSGKPLVIHFWATWCKVCKLEAQNIETLSKKYEVLTIAVNSGEDAKIQAYMKERELTFNVFNDVDSSWAKKFKVEVFPTTFIYDRQGELKFTEVGYTTTAGLLARLKLLE